MNLDLDPHVDDKVRLLESGEATSDDRFIMRLREAGEKVYDTVTWTLPGGDIVEEWSNEHDVEMFEYTSIVQKRYLARSYPGLRNA